VSNSPSVFDEEPSRHYVWYAVALLTLVNVFNYMDRMALAVLAPLIKVDLALSDTELGLLVGMAFALFYAVCSLPIARWADRANRRNIIAVALAIWSVMTALSGAAQHLWQLFVARVGVGAGEAGGLPPAQSLLCDYVPPKRRTGVFAVHNFGLIAGAMLGMVLAGWIGALIGWRWTFVALGVPGLALAVVVRLTLREPVRGHFEAPPTDASSISLSHAIELLWRCRTYRLLVTFLALNGFVQTGLLQWWPSLYERVFNLSLGSVGISLGLAFGAGSGLGVLAGGWLGTQAAKRNARLPLLVGAAALVFTLPTVLASLFVSSTVGSLVLVSLAQLFWGLLAGPVYGTLFSVVPPRVRATAGAVVIFATSVVGAGLGPLCIGVLSDLMTPMLGIEALRYAMLAPLALFPLLVLAIHAATKALPHDLHVAGAAVGTDASTSMATVQQRPLRVHP
jgi:predicted MFS family arabinose efflux permease